MNKRIRFRIERFYDTIEDRDYKVRQKRLQSATGWWITKCDKSRLQSAKRGLLLIPTWLENILEI